MKKISIVIFPVFIVLFALLITSATATQKPPEVQQPVVKADLPVVGSYENLKVLLKQADNRNQAYYKTKGFGGMRAAQDLMLSSAPANVAKMDAAEVTAGDEYSATNVQVRGVDEADIIKTDGKYIYQVNNGKVLIVRAYPADEMKVVRELNFGDNKFTPVELYVDREHLIVIGHTFNNSPIHSTVKTIIYDLSDIENITKIRETELEGNYLSSRKIGSALYLVANKYLDVYRIMESDDQYPTPAYRDSAEKTGFTGIGYDDIHYFPGSVGPDYLIIGGLNLEKPEEAMEVSTYLGAGENIYASANNLYVAVSRYDTGQEPDGKMKNLILPEGNPTAINTEIYKFALAEGRTVYQGKGEVPGTILNQFSMDEYNGYFRIATTKGEVWRTDEYTSKNNIFVLDGTLKIAGRLENIAPGEKIYSVRFMGDRGYMVTFKKVDPLFVLDFKDPKSPKILGELKIPGYSDYLHPYDENHIIGFGKDAVEVPQPGMAGRGPDTMAFYQGMKIAVFDVRDVERPVEMFKEIIGDRGTESDILHNHKALLFSREKNLLAFPVTVMEGEFSFQGAYVYILDLENGFQLRTRISHQSPEINPYKPEYIADEKRMERIIYINNTLYALSKGVISAHDLGTMDELNRLRLNQ